MDTRNTEKVIIFSENDGVNKKNNHHSEIFPLLQFSVLAQE